MRAALAVAHRALIEGEPPFGAVLTGPGGETVAECHDTVRHHGDPMRHAETDLIRRVVAERGPDLAGCTLFTTVEPCPMCFTSAWLAGVSTVVFGASMAQMLAATDGAFVELALPADMLNRASGRPLELVGGVLAEDCLALFREASP